MTVRAVLRRAVVAAALSIPSAPAELAAQVTEAYEALPAEPPIGGPVWTVLIPAVLLVGAFVATWMLYRHFRGTD